MSFDPLTGRDLLAWAALSAVLVASSAASAASPEDRAAAHQHYGQAEELKKKGRLADACKQLEEVERLDPKLPTLIELAECHEQLGDVVHAEADWTAARDRAKHDEKPQSRARAESRLAAVQKRVAHLTLQLAADASGAEVLRDDSPLEPASLSNALAMNPGDHVIVVKLAGHADAKYAIKLADGDNQTLAIAAGPAGNASPSSPPVAPAAAAAAAPPVTPTLAAEPIKQDVAPASSAGLGQRTAGILIGAAGVAAVAGGSALCVIGNRHAHDHGSIVDPRFALGGISAAGGAVLLVTGIALLISTPTDEASRHARLTVQPTLLFARSATVLGAAGEF